MSNTILTAAQEQQIIEKYHAGTSSSDLCKEFKKCQWSIYNVLTKYNISKQIKQSGRNIKNIKQEEVDKIISLYKEGKSSVEIGKIFGTSHTLILKILKTFSTEDRNRNNRNRKYCSDKTYFDNIDTEEKAYFLGFLYSDGNVKKDKSRVSLTLAEHDKEILIKLSDIVYGYENLDFIKSKKENIQNQYSLNIYNKIVAESLIKLGCTPAKSLTLQFPEWLTEKELQRHFIRGYFDGDGSLSVSGPDNQYTWQITSTKDFCIPIYNILKELNINSHFSENKKSIERGNNITKTLSSSGNRQVSKLCNWMYKDATIYLERKYKKYLALKNLCKKIDDSMLNTDRHINQYI